MPPAKERPRPGRSCRSSKFPGSPAAASAAGGWSSSDPTGAARVAATIWNGSRAKSCASRSWRSSDMCATCGCGGEPQDHEHDHGEHHHHQDHDHHHHHHRVVRVEEDVLAKNARIAERNRGWLAAHRVLALNLVSSPGAGKTSLLVRTVRESRLPASVIEGDQAP